MTPEQHLAHLRNADAWTIAPLTPRRAARPRREQSLFMQIASTVAVAAVVAGIVIGGFSLVVPDRSAPPAVPEPTPTPTQVAILDKPAQLFGGDCAAALSDEEASELTGVPMTVLEQGTVAQKFEGQYRFAIEQAGGLHCSWRPDYSTNVLYPAALYVVFLHDDPSNPLETPESCGEPTTQGHKCSIDQVAGGVRFVGGVSGDGDQSQALADSLIATLSARIEDSVQPPAPQPAADAWAIPTDCEALGEKAKLAERAGVDSLAVSTGYGNWGSTRAWEILADGEGLNCYWGDRADVGLEVGVQGGGRWTADLIADEEGAEPVDIEGFDEAYVVSMGDDVRLHVYRGNNWLDMPVDTARLDEAGALLVSFADALDELEG